jgi:hypothetical protein
MGWLMLTHVSHKISILDQCFAPAPQCVIRENKASGEVQVLRLESRVQIFTIRDVAAQAWKQLDGRTPVSQVIDRIVSKHRVSKLKATRDVEKFVRQLLRMKLISKRQAESDSASNSRQN